MGPHGRTPAGLDKFDRQFRWTAGIQLTSMSAVMAALVAVVYR